jgi:membrane protein
MADDDDPLQRLGEHLDQLADQAESLQQDVLAAHPRSARVLDLCRRVIAEQGAEQVGLAASGAAFWVVISAFPAAIAAISVFGLAVTPQKVAGDLSGLARAGPASLGSTVSQQLTNVASSDHAGLSVGLAVSLVLALWSASAGVYNLERAIRTAYGLPRQRYMDARARALVGSFGVVMALGAVALASTEASAVESHVPAVMLGAVAAPLLLLIIAGVTAGLYRFSVGHRVGFRALYPGAVASAVGVVVVAGAFAGYLRLSTHYTAVYGALAGAVIAMVATYLGVYIVLVGAVINVQMAGNRQTAAAGSDRAREGR